ncbi:MAG TPA: PAS domain S-box protein, partial [Verrucomicrobiae bacterium]|nr:PAS domain S-box protein [Verrucomicrobiae bacterium]
MSLIRDPGPLFDDSPDAIVLYDSRGSVVRANAAASALLAYAPGSFAKRFRDHVVKGERADALRQFAVAQGGSSTEFDASFESRIGAVVPVTVTLQPVVEGERVAGIFAIARDASATRSTESALARSEQQFRSIFEYHYDAAIALTLRRTFGRVNVATERLTGYRNEELAGMTMAHVIAPDRLEAATAAMERALHGQTVEFDSVVLRRDGTRCEVSVHAMPMVADRTVYGAFAFLKDVSHQRELERRNEELQRKLAHMA